MRPARTVCAAAIGAALLAGPAAAAPDRTQGTAFMAAYVTDIHDQVQLVSGIGVASAAQIAPGIYQVTFRRKISFDDCFFVAGSLDASFAFVDGAENKDERSIRVFVTDEDGQMTAGDRRFRVLGFCAR